MYKNLKNLITLSILEHLLQMQCMRLILLYIINLMFVRLSVGQEVVVEINSERRCTNARIHSAGHLLDSAFTNLGMTDLIPSKVLVLLLLLLLLLLLFH